MQHIKLNVRRLLIAVVALIITLTYGFLVVNSVAAQEGSGPGNSGPDNVTVRPSNTTAPRANPSRPNRPRQLPGNADTASDCPEIAFENCLDIEWENIIIDDGDAGETGENNDPETTDTTPRSHPERTQPIDIDDDDSDDDNKIIIAVPVDD
ncbi:MAG: hypothetical protein AAF125_09690 [Chloroflexota bacterium]